MKEKKVVMKKFNASLNLLLLFLIININSQNTKKGYVNMTIKGTGEIRLITTHARPSKIYINDIDGYNIRITYSTFYDVYFNATSEINRIQIIWDNIYEINDCHWMFGEKSIISLDLSHFDTSKSGNFYEMFSGCSSLTSLDVSNFNVSNSYDFKSMFKGCMSLISLKLFKITFNKNQYYFDEMFSYCKSLKYLVLEDLCLNNTFGHFYLTKMFHQCTSLISVNLFNNLANHLNSSEIKYKNYELDCTEMFKECTSLENINIFNLNKSDDNYNQNELHLKLTFTDMFNGCTSLKYFHCFNFQNQNAIFFVSDFTRMFYNCSSLISLDLSSINFIDLSSYTRLVISFYHMFYGCYNLKSLKLFTIGNSTFIRAKDFDFREVFTGCSSLRELDLSNIYISNYENSYFNFNKGFYGCKIKSLNISNIHNIAIKSFSQMFEGCYELELIITSNLNIYIEGDMNYMFKNCTSLKKLDLSAFRLNKAINMKGMFYGCNSLKEINITNTKFPNVNSTEEMFFGCSSLNSIDLSGFDFIPNYVDNMFAYCSSLEYINIYNLNLLPTTSYNNIFLGIPEDIVYCSNFVNEKANNLLAILKSKKCSLADCSDFWNEKKMKYYGNDTCLVECYKNRNLKYEYENKCYSFCPLGTHLISNNKNKCEKDIIKCPSDFLYINNFTGECINNCNIFENENKCIINFSNEEERLKIFLMAINDIKKNLINIKINNNDLVYNNNGIIIYITSSFNQQNLEYKNISTIGLGECESILKNYYQIEEDEPLMIFKYDYYIPGIHIPLIGYEVFHPITKAQLDLNLCKDENIKINLNIPVIIDEDNLYKYDPKNEYYNDICIPASSNCVDLTLYERKKEYNNNNLSLCIKGCSFNGYNNLTKKVTCKCDVDAQTSLLFEDIINKDKLLDKFLNIKSNSNIGILRCSKTFFFFFVIKTNIGSYILISLIIIFIILIFLFYFKGQDSLLKKIDKFFQYIKITDNEKIQNENDQVNANVEQVKIKKKKENSQINLINNNLITSKSPNLDSNLNNKENKYNLNLINETKELDNIIKYVDYEINTFTYEEAKEKDKRNFIQYYISLIKTKHILFFSFFYINDYNSIFIKICIFIFSLTLFYVVNALFFSDSTMHKIYEDEGVFNFIYSLPQTIYSSIISGILNTIIKYFSLSEKTIFQFKKSKKEDLNDKYLKMVKNLKIKFIIFFIMSMIFLIFFWYYIGCFGAVYKNTQIYLIKDTLISFAITLIYPFFIYLITASLRLSILHCPEIYYKISKFFQSL